ncbi:beta family protein [Aliivibrio logei]|uniref:Beta family protein n=1 Tax=Aliivibrio logei 5S-186 TaxID=626086 RepID=A0ABX3ARN6_ALILO|nr:beta family protein [Aliivibrio logei]OEF10831.1 hypothetical protein A1Q5_01500 [Aliivibrio logei 5S-186]
MNNYTPFLKFKTCEISALKALKNHELVDITPFFDLATKNEIQASDVENTILKGVRKYELNFKDANGFYIDDYDLDDSLRINNGIVYEFLIKEFTQTSFIPVIGLDRTQERIDVISQYKSNKMIKSNTIALRLNREDFLSYVINEDDIRDILEPLIDGVTPLYNNIHLILDCRICSDSDVTLLSNNIIKFLIDIQKDFDFSKIIITGSSIPPSIADVLPVLSDTHLIRNECEIFERVNHELHNVEIGDYATVSPNYSDVNIPVTALYKIMTPKLVYTYKGHHYFIRGGAIESHPRGAKQYDDMSITLINNTFYRGHSYSIGDAYITDKSQGKGKNAQPSSINKFLVNAHITFMLNDY